MIGQARLRALFASQRGQMSIRQYELYQVLSSSLTPESALRKTPNLFVTFSKVIFSDETPICSLLTLKSAFPKTSYLSQYGQ